MTRTAALLGLSLIGLFCCTGARSQEVYAIANSSFDPLCSCVVASVTWDDDYIAEDYYDLYFSGQIYDSLNTANLTFNNEAGSLEVDNVEMGDEFFANSQIGGDLDNEWEGCVTGSCGQRCTFRNGGSCPNCCFCQLNECPLR